MKLHYGLRVILLVLIMISSLAADAPQRKPIEPVDQFNFLVEIEGVVSAPFERVEGLESTTQVVEYRDGIWANSPRKIPGTTTYSNIILKRSYIYTYELWNWRKKVVDGNVERKNGTIIITGKNREEMARFKFHGAWPVRWRLSALNRNGNIYLIEELEIAVDKLELQPTRTRR
ncbi:phage tail protein [Acidobacteriota bacterium]